MYTNSSFIGKHIYQYNQSEYIIFLSSKYNPISFKNNINKISNQIKNDSIEIPTWEDLGSIIDIYPYITYITRKDDTIQFNGTITADKIFLLFKLNNSNFFRIERFSISNNFKNLHFKLHGTQILQDDFKYMNLPIDKPCSAVSLKYDYSIRGQDGYKAEIKTQIPFYDFNLLDKIYKFFNKSYYTKNKNFIPDLLFPTKDIILQTENQALQEAETALYLKFAELNSAQDRFLSNFKSIEKQSKYYYA